MDTLRYRTRDEFPYLIGDQRHAGYAQYKRVVHKPGCPIKPKRLGRPPHWLLDRISAPTRDWKKAGAALYWTPDRGLGGYRAYTEVYSPCRRCRPSMDDFLHALSVWHEGKETRAEANLRAQREEQERWRLDDDRRRAVDACIDRNRVNGPVVEARARQELAQRYPEEYAALVDEWRLAARLGGWLEQFKKRSE